MKADGAKLISQITGFLPFQVVLEMETRPDSGYILAGLLLPQFKQLKPPALSNAGKVTDAPPNWPERWIDAPCLGNDYGSVSSTDTFVRVC